MMISSRTLRIGTLVVQPSLLAAVVALRGGNQQLLHTAASVLVALWVMMVGALTMRLIEARRSTRGTDQPFPWDHLDVLTATGASVMWMGTAALLGAGLTGWASLSVVGVLGIGSVYLAATWTALVAGGNEPWRRATVTRSIVPAIAVEGDPLREMVRLTGIKIPAGMRLFAMGCTTRHALITRYVVGSDASHSDVELESEIGPAPRGEHRTPAMTLWLGDVLGLSRSPNAHHGEASFSALPKPATVDNVRQLLGKGGDDASARPTHKLPTEGTFRIREYVPGDDARRIHWVRSLQTNQLVVRLPDEIPHAEPAVRLVLDNNLKGADALSCRAPDELLDVLVRVWLGIGKALAETGTRVTLVAAAAKGDDGAIVPVERPMIARSREGLRLGARVAWQDTLPLAALLKPTARHVVVSSRPRPIESSSEVVWIVVPAVAWTSLEPWLPKPSGVTLPFPTGSADNRLGRRRRERKRVETMWNDRTIFTQGMCWIDWRAFSGAYVARPAQGHVALAVIP